MLTSLLHGGVGEIVAVCTRYYGGVKLGTGGLARAYSGGVKLALETLPTDEKVARVWLVVTVGYADVDGMQRLIDELDIVVENEEYGAEVQYVLGVPSPDEQVLRTSVGDLTRGKGRVEVQ
jgi:putative IMPACT (imprinted ancient) family translation regulator